MLKLSVLYIAGTLSVIAFYQRENAILEFSNINLYNNVLAQHRIFEDCKRGVIKHPPEWRWYQQ